ncbi:MAG: endonuclease Q family protein [Candidatus ainarchaeum sp.]|nr:endonuclease Q family protein [Candidatus ainarchaeum sp.]
MKTIADLHIHSKYARATSSNCDLEGLSHWAKIKGIGIVSTGDITHPTWFNELKAKLSNSETGLYNYKDTLFCLGGEVSLIYNIQESTKKMHIALLFPSFEIASQFNDEIKKFGNLKEDGRPMLHIQPSEFADIVKNSSKNSFIMLAHVWTPWFSIFGSKSGVNSIEEAFGDRSNSIDGLETGLSSDPKMNWMLSSLDNYPLLSNSDAHSPQKLGREANLFDLKELTYQALTNAIKTKKGFLKTYEFYPEEGKYHFDGHRNCNVLLSPEESEKINNLCPVCRKKLTIGVMHRIFDLADRKEGQKPKNAVPFSYLVPLTILLSKVLKKGENTLSVQEEYFKLTRYFGSEFNVYESSFEELKKITSLEIAKAIDKVNKGNIYWIPGYDGVFGELQFEKTTKQIKNQKNLLDY